MLLLLRFLFGEMIATVFSSKGHFDSRRPATHLDIIYIYIYIYIYILCMCTYACMHVCMCVFVYMYVHVHMHEPTYGYKYTCTHACAREPMSGWGRGKHRPPGQALGPMPRDPIASCKPDRILDLGLGFRVYLRVRVDLMMMTMMMLMVVMLCSGTVLVVVSCCCCRVLLNLLSLSLPCSYISIPAFISSSIIMLLLLLLLLLLLFLWRS